MLFSAQDVVHWDHTVQAEGIGGWEFCGGALTSSAVFVRGKIPDREAQGFSHDKRNLLFTSSCSILNLKCTSKIRVLM